MASDRIRRRQDRTLFGDTRRTAAIATTGQPRAMYQRARLYSTALVRRRRRFAINPVYRPPSQIDCRTDWPSFACTSNLQYRCPDTPREDNLASRDIPADVRRALRTEVGFVCPVAGCGSPY